MEGHSIRKERTTSNMSRSVPEEAAESPRLADYACCDSFRLRPFDPSTCSGKTCSGPSVTGRGRTQWERSGFRACLCVSARRQGCRVARPPANRRDPSGVGFIPTTPEGCKPLAGGKRSDTPGTRIHPTAFDPGLSRRSPALRDEAGRARSRRVLPAGAIQRILTRWVHALPSARRYP